MERKRSRAATEPPTPRVRQPEGAEDVRPDTTGLSRERPSDGKAPSNGSSAPTPPNGVRRVTGSTAAPGPPSPTAVTRTLTAEQAQQAAGEVRQARATRVLPASRKRTEIPPLPPAAHAPTKLAPLMLVLFEMLV